MDKEELKAAKEKLSLQRWTDAENGFPEYHPFFPEKPLEELPEGLDPITMEWMRFYAVKRGHHPNAPGGFTTTSDMALLNFRLLDFSRRKCLQDQYYLLWETGLILQIFQ